MFHNENKEKKKEANKQANLPTLPLQTSVHFQDASIADCLEFAFLFSRILIFVKKGKLVEVSIWACYPV